jgi:DNA polymerase III delta prime subunit
MIAYAPTPKQYVPRVEEDDIRRELSKVRESGASRVLLLYGPGGIGKTSLVRQLAEKNADAETVWLEPIDVDDPECWLLSNLEGRVAKGLDPDSRYFAQYWAQISRLPDYTQANISHETIVNYLGRVKRVFADCYAEYVTAGQKAVVVTFDTVETIRGTNLLLTLTRWIKALPKATLFILSGRPLPKSPDSQDGQEDKIVSELESRYQGLPVRTVTVGEFGLDATRTYIKNSEIAQNLRRDEESQLALLSRGNPLWLAFLIDYLKQDGMLPETSLYPLAYLEEHLPFGREMSPEGLRVHEEFLRRLVAPYQGTDLFHESVKRLAVVRQPVAKVVWQRLMSDLAPPHELDQAWQDLLDTSWIRPRGNKQFLALHDALAEELAQRLFPLHDQDQRWRHDIWGQALNVYSELAAEAEAGLGLDVSTLDEELREFDRAASASSARAEAAATELQQQFMAQAATLYARRREADMLKAASLYYLFLTSYEQGSRRLLADFRQAEERHDSFFQDLLVLYLDRFLPGGTRSEAFNDVIRLKLDDFRTWLLSEPGHDLYIDLGLMVGRYHIAAAQPDVALELVSRLPANLATSTQRHGLHLLRGNACMRIPALVKQAQDHFEHAVIEAEALRTPDRHKLLAEAYKERGFFYRNTGQWQEADLAYRRAWETISNGLTAQSRQADRAELASIQTNWAYVLGLGGHYREGLELADSAIVIRRQLHRRADEGLSWSVLGEVHRYARRYPQAWRAYAAAERLLQGRRYFDRMGFVHQEQAICLFQAYNEGLPLTSTPVADARRLIGEALELSLVSIHFPQSVMPELLCVTSFGCGSGGSGDRRDPGISGEGVADGGEDGGAVLCGGGGVAADRIPVAGALFRAEPAADLLLGFRGAQVAFGLVGGGRDGGVGQEPQYVGFTAAQAFQERQRGWLLAAGQAADFGQPDGHAVPEQPQVLRSGVVRHGGQALLAGQIRLVDQGAQGVLDLPGPDRVRVGLGGVLKITKQMLAA